MDWTQRRILCERHILLIFCDVISPVEPQCNLQQYGGLSYFISCEIICVYLYSSCLRPLCCKINVSVSIKGLSCVVLVCKEMHWSYVGSLSERRVCLVPNVIEDSSLDDLLERVTSPALIRIYSSCDNTVSIIFLLMTIDCSVE